MLSTNISHGDLQLDFNDDKTVQITRKSNTSGILLSLTEWKYILAVAELLDFPMVAPEDSSVRIR